MLELVKKSAKHIFFSGKVVKVEMNQIISYRPYRNN